MFVRMIEYYESYGHFPYDPYPPLSTSPATPSSTGPALTQPGEISPSEQAAFRERFSLEQHPVEILPVDKEHLVSLKQIRTEGSRKRSCASDDSDPYSIPDDQLSVTAGSSRTTSQCSSRSRKRQRRTPKKDAFPWDHHQPARCSTWRTYGRPRRSH